MKVVATAIVTAVLTSAFWIFVYNIALAPKEPNGAVTAAGDVATVDPKAGPAGLAIPVVGVRREQLVDTFTQARAGRSLPHDAIDIVALAGTPVVAAAPGTVEKLFFTQARARGSRPHDAIDIMAPAGTPIVAAAPGTVEKLFFSQGGGGITAYVRSDDGRWTYYYAHLQDYAPGLAEGQHVVRGTPIGRVGSTGNASAAGPHLHFAINRMNRGEKWWQGTAINPYPLLAGKKTNG